MVGRAGQGVIRRGQLPDGLRQIGPRGVENGGVVQPGPVLPGGRATQAVPGIEPDVVMVAAGRNERCLVAEALHELETQNALVKSQGFIQIRNPQVHVADARLGRRHVGGGDR